MGNASDTNARRFLRLREIGCYCCAKLGWHSPPDMHHILSGGQRMGDEYTVPLCPYHHRGVQFDRWSKARMVKKFGPSLAHGSKPFEKRWGTQLEMLDEINEIILGV